MLMYFNKNCYSMQIVFLYCCISFFCDLISHLLSVSCTVPDWLFWCTCAIYTQDAKVWIHYWIILEIQHYNIMYTGCRPDHPYQPTISKTERGRQKYFRQRFQVTHYMAISVWPWRVLSRSRKGHFEFCKWNPLFFITYSCILFRELSKNTIIKYFFIEYFSSYEAWNNFLILHKP